MEIRSENKGPTIWLTGCIHGDEIGGTVLIHELCRILKRTLLRGRICAFPIVNPFGFEATSRYLPYSKEDLNRLFPGNKHGSLGERITHLIFETILKDKPDLVLDLHNDWIRSIPYTLIDQTYVTLIGTQLGQNLTSYARAIGFPIVIDTETITGSLTDSMLKAGIAAITLEIGEPLRVNESMTRKGVNAIISLLVLLEMVEEHVAGFNDRQKATGNFLYYETKPLSTTSGIIRFKVVEGQCIKKDQVIARVYNAFGMVQETLYALHNGLVLGKSDHSLSFPGFPVIAMGIEKDN
jgi:predicted deacylase